MEQPRHVLYFALRPPPEITARAGRLLSTTFGLRGVPPERLHVSLTPLGRFGQPPAALIEAARRAVAQVDGPTFRLDFNRLGAWGRGVGARPIVLSGDEGVIGAEALHEAIHARLAAAGLVHPPPRPIWPHMTLARGQGDAPERVIPPVGWRVGEFVLIHSYFGQGRHDLLGRWTLSGGTPMVPAEGESRWPQRFMESATATR